MFNRLLKLLQIRSILKAMDIGELKESLDIFLWDLENEEIKSKIRERMLSNKTLVKTIMWWTYGEVMLGMMTDWEVGWLYKQFMKERELPKLYADRFEMIFEVANTISCYRLLSTVLLGVEFKAADHTKA